MVGRDAIKVSSNASERSENKILSVKNLSYRDKRGLTQLEQVSFDLHQGEVARYCSRSRKRSK